LVFYLYRSQDIAKAYEQAKIIIQDLASKKTEIDKELLISARGSAIYSVVSEQGTLTATASTNYFNYLKGRKSLTAATKVIILTYLYAPGLPPTYNETYIKKLKEVTEEEILTTLDKYLGALVADKNSSNVAITCNPSKADELVQAFAGHGITLQSILVESLFKKGDNDEGDASGDEDDDDEHTDGEHTGDEGEDDEE